MKRRLAAAAVGLSLAMVPVATMAETLADAFILAYRHSGLLEQNRALLRAADEDVAVAVAATRPAINYSIAANATRRNALPDLADLTVSASITADLTLYDFGKTQLAIDAAKETVLATREALVNVEQSVLNDAATAYLAVLRDAAIVELRQSNVRLITQELQAARDRFEVGEVTRTDVSIAEARLASARSLLVSAQGTLAATREQYRVAVGQYPAGLVFPNAVPTLPDSLAAAEAIAVRTHPQIRQAMREVTVAELNILRAEAQMKPSLTARASIGVDQDFDSTNSLGVTLSGPIYQGGRLSALLRQAQARRDAARAALHLTRHSVEQAVRVSWSNLLVAQATLDASREQVRSATLAFRGVQEEAKLGARTTLDVLNAEQELLDARGDEISARTQQIVSVFNILASMGLLTVDHLNLGITTYDPAAYYNAVRDAPTRFVSPQGEKLDRVLRALNR
jgi:outer membrane protein